MWRDNGRIKQGEKRARGNTAEDIAVGYLDDCGYRVLERNFYFSHCETDIIAEDDTYIIFVEVKARRTGALMDRYGRPATAVDRGKRARLISCARSYITTHPTSKRPRLDIIEVYILDDAPLSRKNTEIKHIKNAFGA